MQQSSVLSKYLEDKKDLSSKKQNSKRGSSKSKSNISKQDSDQSSSTLTIPLSQFKSNNKKAEKQVS